MTVWLLQDYEARGEQDADRVTASPEDLAAEYRHGAETAYRITTLAAANGHTADYIEARQQELAGPQAGQDTRTPAEQKWARGYAHGAESVVSLRERETDDADERAAHGRETEYEAEAG
jgi:hypothetical protein